jgi:hypothetical protein
VQNELIHANMRRLLPIITSINALWVIG